MGLGFWTRTHRLVPAGVGAVSTAVSRLSPGSVVAVDGRAVGWIQFAHPRLHPLKDLRAEVYSAPTTREYKAFADAGPGWPGYAEQHGVDAILADRTEPLDPALAKDSAWRVAAADEDFRLWVRP